MLNRKTSKMPPDVERPVASEPPKRKSPSSRGRRLRWARVLPDLLALELRPAETSGRPDSKAYALLIILNAFLFAVTLLAGLKIASAFLIPSIFFALPASLMMPGFMLTRVLGIRIRKLSETILFSVGASIFLLFATGLLINTLLPLLGISRPLDTLPVAVLVVSLNAVLAYACLLLSVDLSLDLKFPRFSFLTAAVFSVPPLFVIGAILGAVGLNNHASNLPVMIVLGSIGAYALLLLILREKAPKSVFPYSLFFMTLALILGTSLRGWVISGHDIMYEFSVFEMTKNFGSWSMAHYHDAYNACLSITMLPAMLSGVLPKIPDQLILRGLFQAIFALTPVGLFLFLRRYVTAATAFIASLFFISQAALIQDFAFLTREEIALFFYTLALLAFSSRSLSRFQQYLLAIFFGVSMAWSHYSTTYIAIAILLFVLVFRSRIAIKIMNFFKRIAITVTGAIMSQAPVDRVSVTSKEAFRQLSGKSTPARSSDRWLPGWGFILLLMLMTVTWYMWVTGTQSNLTTFVVSVYRNFSQGGFGEYKAGLTDQLGIYSNSKKQSSTIDTFILSNTGGNNTANGPHYSPADYANYDPNVNSNIMLNASDRFSQKLYSDGEISKKFAKIFIIAGVMWLVLSGVGSFIVDDDFRIFMATNVLVLGLAMVMPVFSEDYSLMRAYQQLLLGLSLPAVLGAYALFRIILRRYSFIVTGLFFVIYFLLLSSFLPQLLGFGYAQLNLNNTGLYYDIHYTHRAEQQSIAWLSKNINHNYPVYADFYAKKKIDVLGEMTIWVMPNVLPENINRDAYVYADYANSEHNLAFSPYGGDELGYAFPAAFLSRHKDIIYSNGQTEIFK